VTIGLFPLYLHLHLLQAVPGTKLHQRQNVEGRLIGHTTGNNLDGTNFVPRMNRDKTEDLHRSASIRARN
jgi:uncharacterized protein DUF4070